jgi:hypothetical protein
MPAMAMAEAGESCNVSAAAHDTSLLVDNHHLPSFQQEHQTQKKEGPLPNHPQVVSKPI